MTTPVPATIVNELNGELNNMAWTRSVNELAVRRVKTRAQALKALDIVAYHSVLGRCACLLGDFPEMRSHLSAAIKIAPNNPETHIDYGISVSMWGFHNEAWKHMQTAYKLADSDPSVIRRVLRECWQNCRFHDAKKLMDRLIQLGVKLDQGDESSPYAQIIVANRFYETLDLTDEQGAASAEAFGSFLRKSSIFNPAEAVNFISHSDGQPHIVYSADVISDDVEELNWKMYEYFADLEIEVEQRGFIVYKLVPAKPEHTRVA